MEKQETKNVRRFSQKQYDMLLRCSEKEDMTEWNQWREENPNEVILLERAELNETYLQGANLQNAVLWEAKLIRSNLRETHLQNAKMMRAYLQGAEFGCAKLQGADFSRAIINGETLIWRCEVDRRTKFEGVGLESIRIYPDIKQLLEYNIRRMNWEDWYKKGPWWQRIRKSVINQGFWLISDYGMSAPRVIGVFFIFAFLFAIFYWFFPSCVKGIVEGEGLRSFLHAFYFSVVTMTTLGFGDIAANPNSWMGQVLLMIQVILGYVVLGALVTRFAILFTAGGPAGKFSKKKRNIKQGDVMKETNPTKIFLESFREETKSLRKWLVAYGVGASAFLLSQENFALYITKGDNKVIVILLLAGTCIQVVAAFAYKYISWPLHLCEQNNEYKNKKRYRVCKSLYDALWFELIFDAPTLIMFFVATIWVFAGVAGFL
jgi:hypothetical protein